MYNDSQHLLRSECKIYIAFLSVIVQQMIRKVQKGHQVGTKGIDIAIPILRRSHLIKMASKGEEDVVLQRLLPCDANNNSR